MEREVTQLKLDKGFESTISPKDVYKWLVSKLKDAQHH